MQAKLWYAATAAVCLVACAGDKKQAHDPGDEPVRPGPTLGDDEPGRGAPGEPSSDLGDFDEEAAQNVLKRSERKAEQCVSVVPDMPTGEGSIEVVFDGPKGRVVDVELGYPFSTGSEGAMSCIKNSFIGEIIPPFRGKKKVSHSLTLAEPSDKKP